MLVRHAVLGDDLVEVHHTLFSVVPFLNVAAREETFLKAVGEDVLQALHRDVEVIQGHAELPRHRGVRDEPVVRTDGHGHPVVQHVLELVVPVLPDLRVGLQVRGQADLDHDPLVGDEGGELLDVVFPVGDPRVGDLPGVEEVVPVAQAVRVEGGDPLEDAFRTVGLPGVDGLVHEVVVGVGVDFPELVRRVPFLLAREVDPDDGDALLVPDLHHGLHHLESGFGDDLHLLGVLHHLEELGVVGGVALRAKLPHGTADDAVVELRLVAAYDLGSVVVFLLRALEAPVAGVQHRLHGEPALDVDQELGREAGFDVVDPFVLVIDGELVGGALDVLQVPQDVAGVLEAVEVLREVGVALLEDQLAQPRLRHRREVDLEPPGHLDERRDPHRSVEVQVEVRLRHLADEGV